MKKGNCLKWPEEMKCTSDFAKCGTYVDDAWQRRGTCSRMLVWTLHEYDTTENEAECGRKFVPKWLQSNRPCIETSRYNCLISNSNAAKVVPKEYISPILKAFTHFQKKFVL
ncbi:hypothetical protein TNCV_1223131 [Trichonephila clavipes]|nr:hypothetical protein TNCV_1223131 [Trichonephila clavipes]